jgi:glutamine amidotransferase
MVKKLDTNLPLNDHAKVPQIAWNQITEKNIPWEQTPLNGLNSGIYQYFVHSYYTKPDNDNYILSKTNYEGFEYCSSILKDNLFACQFHPEKSGANGLKIYQNWLNSL